MRPSEETNLQSATELEAWNKERRGYRLLALMLVLSGVVSASFISLVL